MKIVALEAENIKKLKAVNIKPDGSMIVIGGDNEAGKSSLLDSIEYALGGTKSIPSKPIRNGEEKAKVVLDLGDIIVTRTFTQKGTNLTVKNKDGATFSSPQAMLDKLVGNLSFDPLAFANMNDKERLATLKSIAGLDFTNFDKKYKEIFDKRTDVNRQGKELKANFDVLDISDNISEEEISVSDISKQLTFGLTNNQTINQLKQFINGDENRLKQLENEKLEIEQRLSSNNKKLKSLKIVNTDELSVQLNSAEETNKKIRINNQKKELGIKLDKLRNLSQQLSEELIIIDNKKQELLENSKLPIKGLTFDENGVIFKDIPFDQCSSAQKIKISVAMGLAMNPELRILLIRDGSLLDSKNLAIIAEMATKRDAQVWIERVSKGKECQIIISDGCVAQCQTV